MSTSVKYAKDESGNNYTGLYIDCVTVDAPGLVDGSTRRMVLDGVSSRFVAMMNSNVVGMDFHLFTCVFNRADNVAISDDEIGQRLFTTYAAPFGPRVAVGINNNKLAVLLQDTDQELHLFQGFSDVTHLVDHHLMIRIGDDDRVTAWIDGLVELDITTVSLATPGLSNPYVGGDGNRRLFKGDIDQVAILDRHNFTKLVEYFDIVAFDKPSNYMIYSRFDPDKSAAIYTITDQGYTVENYGGAVYKTALTETAYAAAGVSSVEFIITLESSSTRIGAAAGSIDVELDSPLGSQVQSIGIDGFGNITYTNALGEVTVYTTGQLLKLGDVARLDYNSGADSFDFYVNDLHVETIPVDPGVTWYAGVSMRSSTMSINTGQINFSSNSALNGLVSVTYTEAEGECLYTRIMPKDADDDSDKAALLFLEEIGPSFDIVDEFTGDKVGEYLGPVTRLQPSLTPDSEDVSVALTGGQVKLTEKQYLDVWDKRFFHMAMILEYEDLFEDKTLFELHYEDNFNNPQWLRFFLRAGEVAYEDSGSGGSPDYISTGYIFPIQDTVTFAVNIDSGDLYIYSGGEEFAVAVNAFTPPTMLASGPYEAWIGSDNTAAAALTQRFSHCVIAAGTVAEVNYPEWKVRRINEKIDGVGLVEEATYVFPLETISQRLYDLVTIEFPSQEFRGAN